MVESLLPATAAVATVATMITLLRRRRLKEKYAFLWLVVAVGVAVVAAWPELLAMAAGLLGVRTPSNLLFFVAALVLLVVSVQLSAQVSQLEEETRSLAEELAILRLVQERDSLQRDLRSPRHASCAEHSHEAVPAPTPEVAG